MSQNDLVIDNQNFPATRADINNALQALGSLNSGSSAPATTYANMLWYDTSNNTLKMRSEANDQWISIGYLDQSADAFRIFDDTQVVNSSGTQTGLIGDQATSAWEAGTSTTESLVSPDKIAAAITALSAPSGLSSTQVFTSSSTWSKPSGITKVLVFVTGGGGGGYVTGTGIAAGTAIALLDVSSVSSASITVGAGGGGTTSGSSIAGSNSVWSDGFNTNVVGAASGSSSGGDLNMEGGGSSFWGSTYGSGGVAGSDPDEGPNISGGNGGDGVVWVVEFR